MQFLDETGRVAKAIVIHPNWTSRGYVFVSSAGGQIYMIANTADFNLACAQIMMKEEPEDLYQYIFDVPVSQDESLLMKAIGGQYIWTLPLQ